MRLRRKITITFFLVSSAVSVLLAVFLYRFIKEQLGDEVRGRLKDMAHLGAAEVELEPYQSLVGQLTPTGELDDAKVAAIEHSPAYHVIYSHLRMIRSAEPALVHYAYLLAPTADPKHPKFVVDADVLEFDALQGRGAPLPPNESISHFNSEYDISDLPLLEKALTECSGQLERDFIYDTKFKVSSVSAYMPLTDDDGNVLRDAHGKCLGVLGLDITDRKMRAALDDAGSLALRISLAMLAVTLLVSIGLGTLLTRPILALTDTVRRFANKDFRVRTHVRSRDEVGQLGENFNQMAETIQLHSEHLEDLVEKRTKELNDEKQTSERLLLNVLPQKIADRLKGGESLIVDRFEAVTVLFADICGFTTLSAQTTPEKLVTMLNDLFSSFDKLAEQHGLEKIKTIGDAYMVVSGIPQPVPDHAVRMAKMGEDIIAAVEEYATRANTPLAIRVGIHSGPVVAGVIGQKKFIYDLWGDTVNTASRMESHGIPNRVHLSEVTAELVKDHYELEPRGEIDIKSKGKMRTFLLGKPR
ncbi:MAG: adenylate/guanylate cyclase domain-containing protein [Deltaproteobacteria bacterium]